MKILLPALALAALIPASAFSTECVAPASPGGGWDFTCRQVGKILYELGEVDSPVQVTNMDGAGGGLAFSFVANKRANDGDLIAAASSATTARLAQNAYGGMKADAVRWVGAIGADPGVIAVSMDSPYQTLEDLMTAVREDPASVRLAGGSAVGGFDHLKPMLLFQQAGVENLAAVPYIGVNSGADAITRTVGGFTDAMSGDLSEITSFIKAKEIRPLAVLTKERVPGFEDIPTAAEQGYDVVAVNWRGFYVPPEITDEAFDLWAERLSAVAESDAWKEAMAANGLSPFTLVGDDFQAWVDETILNTRKIYQDLGIEQQ